MGTLPPLAVPNYLQELSRQRIAKVGLSVVSRISRLPLRRGLSPRKVLPNVPLKPSE